MRKRYEATRPLEAVQIDHAKVDAIVVDDDGRELGRPWIALGFDALTRVVTGFHLTMAPPTRLSTGLCLLHSVCDKTRWLKDRGIPFEWPVSGLPEVVLTDSNSFFGPRAFVRACKDVGIKNVWNAAREAKYGAHIESQIGTRLGDVPLLTDAALTDRSEREGCGRSHVARLSMPELESWIGAEITGKYHRKRHAALRRAPIAAWRALAPDGDFRSPIDCVSFRLSFLPEEECDLRADGVRLLGQTFWSRALADDFDADKKKLAVRYDPRDLSRIFVKRPSGRFVKAFNAAAIEATAARFGADGGDGDLVAALPSGRPVGDLFVNAAPGLSIERRLRVEEAAKEVGALALALSDDVLEWSDDAANRCDRRDGPLSPCGASGADFDDANRECERKCVSSCPFQPVGR